MATIKLNISFRRALYILIMPLLIITGCGRTETEKRLDSIDKVIEDSPEAALDSLSSISGVGMTDAELNRLRVLKTKARDKAYICHTSTDTIQEAVDYYTDHGSKEERAEAYYYAGRVYSDIGDYPNALRFFQDALDILPASDNASPSMLKLCGNVLSQTARLLNSLRLYKEAIPYIKETLKIDYALTDTTSVIYDMDMLGAVCMHMGDYENADKCFIKAEQLSRKYTKSDYGLKGRMYRAASRYIQGNKAEALKLIRNVPEKINDDYKFTTLGYAASIYKENGIYDTAYIYAQKLISYPNNKNIKAGYEVILSPGVRDYAHKDSLDKYIDAYKSLLEKHVKKNGDRQALIQLSQYNYKLHEKSRLKAEADKHLFQLLLILAILLSYIVILLYISAKYRLNKKIIELLKTREYIDKLNVIAFENGTKNCDKESKATEISEKTTNKISKLEKLVAFRNSAPTQESLQEEMLDKLRALIDKCETENNNFDDRIISSEVYKSIGNYIRREKAITINHPLWAQIENLVNEIWPDFKITIEVLSGDKIDDIDWQILMLLKLNIKLVDIAKIISKSINTVSSRRSRLAIKIFGLKMSTKDFDTLIYYM